MGDVSWALPVSMLKVCSRDDFYGIKFHSDLLV